MFATLLRRLRRQKSQRRAALIPPDLSLRDSFRSSFPRISDGGYSLYYELELLSRKRAYREAQNLRIPTTRKRIPVLGAYLRHPYHYLRLHVATEFLSVLVETRR
ncbi:hypothetical protein C0991_003791 [Blastosporella zonata]|nr:hypothetical protein C0991_003791 [Blastosporella zonata]